VSLVVRSPLLRAALLALSVGAVIAACATSTMTLLVPALLLLLPVATSLSQAGRLAAALHGFRHIEIDATVWGAPIPRSRTGAFRVRSVGAVGAGLLISLTDGDEKETLLKIAQPRSWRVDAARVVVQDAAYVQWAGRKLARAEGLPAVVIQVV
jgi:hypothetical protein